MAQKPLGLSAYGFQLEDGSVNFALWSEATDFAGPLVPDINNTKLPSVADMFWHDNTTGNWNVRDRADTAWIKIGTINQGPQTFTPSGSFNVRTLSATQSVALLTNDQYVLVNNNTGAPITLNPPLVRPTDSVMHLVDAAGNATASNISINATVSTVHNPVLIATNFGWADLLFSGGLVYLVGSGHP